MYGIKRTSSSAVSEAFPVTQRPVTLAGRNVRPSYSSHYLVVYGSMELSLCSVLAIKGYK
jgi:hypothetical protein